MPFPYSNPQVTIASGASLSAAFYCGAGDIQGIAIPAAWTAANLTFQGSVDGVTFENLYDDSGNELVVTAAAGLTSSVGGYSMPYMKIRSGTSGVPVNQGADRVLSVTVRKRLFMGV